MEGTKKKNETKKTINVQRLVYPGTGERTKLKLVIEANDDVVQNATKGKKENVWCWYDANG